MSVGHFEAHDGYAYAVAGDDFFNGMGYAFGEEHEAAEQFVIELEELVYFLFGDDEGVPLLQGADVEEGEVVFGFGYFVGGDFSRDDFGEDAGHGVWVLRDGLCRLWGGQSLDGYLEDFEFDLSCRSFDDGGFAHFFTEQAFAYG